VAAARRQLEREEAEASPAPAGLYVPRAGEDRGRPLLVFLHGLGGSGAELVQRLELVAFADAQGFAFMAPEGSPDYSGRRFWNASASCCNFDQLAVDHVAQLRNWITEALRHPGLDPGRVYVIGYSNGGFMAYRAACELSPLLRGIFSIAGAGPSDGEPCNPVQSLSVVEIHGDRDAIVDFAGGHLFADTRRPRHPSVQRSLSRWAKQNGCAGPQSITADLDLDPRIAGSETQVQSYAGCAEHPVESWQIRGGDHAAGLSRYSLEAIGRFIRGAALNRP
jgi:polyhydroxybutyrate depolymerase